MGQGSSESESKSIFTLAPAQIASGLPVDF
jgi:hypothetical protein